MHLKNLGMMVLLLISLLIYQPYSSFADSPKKAQAPATVEITKDARWKQKMQSLYQSLTELLTDVCSDQRYYDSKNSSRIEREIKSITNFSHELNKNTKDTAKSDPTLELFSGFLANETSEAYRSFRGGQKEYAREILRSIPANCLACHSRNATGPSFNALSLEPSAPLSPLEKSEFLAATRQFDRAVIEFQKVIRGKETPKTSPYEIEKALHESLSIAVRYKRDPILAKSIVQTVIDNLEGPQFLQEDAASWKKSIDEWIAESPREIKTEEGAYSEAQRLIAHARTVQTYPMDHSANIIYLRASSVLYDLLQLAPNGKHMEEALLLLGMCYEVLSPRRMENLHNIYYEACIQKAPHSDTARACYRRYEQSIYMGFTGSSGTHLPQEIKDKLTKLWALAKKTD